MALSSIIVQQIISVLQNSTFTSANPIKTNYVKDINASGLDAAFDQLLVDEIIQIIEQNKGTTPKEDISEVKSKKKKKGFGEPQAVSLASKAIRGAQNPASLVQMGLQRLPHAALIALAISLAPMIFEILIAPGGPFDVRFKRIVDDEINAFLSRQTQKDTEFGYRQVIIQSKLGFTAPNGVNNYNTVRGIREGGLIQERLDRFGMVDQTKGNYWPFG